MNLVKEYEILVHRMTQTTRLRTAERIRNDFDVELFKQMVEHGAFDGNSMLGLVNTTFGWIKKLHCPFRDEEADAAKARVMGCKTMDKVVHQRGDSLPRLYGSRYGRVHKVQRSSGHAGGTAKTQVGYLAFTARIKRFLTYIEYEPHAHFVVVFFLLQRAQCIV